MYKIIELAHLMLRNHLKSGDIVIDATCGAGNDTLFLANIVGPNGHVYSYDIQEEALLRAKELTKDYNNITYYLESHENIYINKYDGIIFNFGYLPKGDKTITTKAAVSLKAIQNLVNNINQNALIVLVLYPGHYEGKIESTMIENYLENLDAKKYLVSKYTNCNQHNAPYLMSIMLK